MQLYQNILQLPKACLQEKRLTKAFFLKHFKLNSAEKKLLNQQIVAMQIVATLKPSNVNIPANSSALYSYEEILIIKVQLADKQLELLLKKVINLIQKYIPYHLLLIVADEFEFAINTYTKNINQNDQNKRTLNNSFTTPKYNQLFQIEADKAFFDALAFSKLDKTNLETLYQSYSQAIVQAQTAQHTGSFTLRNKKRTQQDLENILKIEMLEEEIISLASQIKKADQLNQKVQLNVQIQETKQAIKKLKENLI